MGERLKVKFPQGTVYAGGGKRLTLRYNKSYINKFNTKLNQTQVFIDNKVVNYLQEYVSYKTGVQMKSIPLSSNRGEGVVWINVPYAEYQAYSKRIKKRVGKRGTQPFERMKAEKKDTILQQTIAYARRINK